jgi:uncharacterized protein (DUF169 family)
MSLVKTDFSILEKFNFEIPPVGVKFAVKPPAKIARIGENLTLCEMLRHAQKGNVFYAGAESHTCDAGLYILGQADLAEPYINGEFGAGLGVFDSPRSAGRLYLHVMTIGKGVVKYVVFSPLDKLTFDPDVLLILASTGQAEIILRASTYKTGDMWSSSYTSAIGCSWLITYPYLTGKLNYITTGLGFGMRRRKIFPEGMMFISVPFTILPSLLQTLRDMPWVPEPYKPGGVEYVSKLRKDLGLD